MQTYEKLRGDHLQLMVLAQNLSRLTSYQSPPCRIELFEARTKLASSLIRHLKEEDWVVYPALLRSSDLAQRGAVLALQKQTGNLASTFSKYMQRWTSVSIQSDWSSYRRETSLLLKELQERITREDKHLYGAAANDTVQIVLSNSSKM